MADVFLGGSLFLACSFRQRPIVVGKSFWWARCFSMYVARAVYLLGVTILMLLFANFFFKDLLVFFPRTSIHFPSSKPPHRHSSLVSPLSVSLPLLLSSDALLACLLRPLLLSSSFFFFFFFFILLLLEFSSTEKALSL